MGVRLRILPARADRYITQELFIDQGAFALAGVEARARATRVVAGVRPPGVGVEVDVFLSPLVLQGLDDAADDATGHGCLPMGERYVAYRKVAGALRYVSLHE